MTAIAFAQPRSTGFASAADLYRRRRLAAAGLLALLLVAVLLLADVLAARLDGGGAGIGTGDRPSAVPVAEVSVVVEPGDTVWSVAESLAPGDPRPYVDAIVAANGGPDLVAGQRLVLPAP